MEDARGLEKRIKADDIKVAVLTVSVSEAPKVAQRLARAGLKAILSFAPCPLTVPDDVRVRCVDLATEMARLVYYL